MAIRHKFAQRQAAMPVPYGPSYENGRTNNGFIDLRGRPQEAAQVVEAIGSKALGGILIRAAEKSSPLFTIGCDLGRHRWSRTGLKNPEVAGGYLHLAIADYQSADSQLYEEMAEKIVIALKPYSAEHRWRIGLLVEFCEFQLDNEECFAPSLQIYFWASEPTVIAAIESREVFLTSLRERLFSIAADLSSTLA